MTHAAAGVIAFFLTATPASSRVAGALSPGQTSLPPGTSQPRDKAAAPGTAVLRGRVVASDTGRPIRRARVRIFSDGSGGRTTAPQNRSTATDGDGKHEFKTLPAGRYIVMVSKASYVTLSYGQRRPNEPGKPLEILDAQMVEKVDFSLPRGAILTGRILDEFGEPAESVSISPLPSREAQRNRMVDNGHSTSTNDLGEFRLVGVPAGTVLPLGDGIPAG
jgi:hypothetical protein